MPPSRFVSEIADTDLGYSGGWTFELTEVEGGSRLTITERGFLQFPESKRLEVLRSNEQGWDEQARNVAAHVEA